MTTKLAQRDDIKQRLDLNGSAEDALLDTMIEQASDLASQLAGRPLGREESRIEYPVASGHSDRLRLDRYPIESVASVKSIYGPGNSDDFAAADELSDGDDYIIDSAELGVLQRFYDTWRSTPRSNLVIYTAGFGDPANLPAGAIAPPGDLQHGIAQQVIRWWNTKGQAGLREIDAGEAGGRISLAETKPHPELIEACRALRRLSL
ncbi:MAG: hypothetical protein AAGA29_05900 [Planctomycetota bacterium]